MCMFMVVLEGIPVSQQISEGCGQLNTLIIRITKFRRATQELGRIFHLGDFPFLGISQEHNLVHRCNGHN